jgi:hypothetical protein
VAPALPRTQRRTRFLAAPSALRKLIASREAVIAVEVLLQYGPHFAGYTSVIGLSARPQKVVVIFVGGERNLFSILLHGSYPLFAEV